MERGFKIGQGESKPRISLSLLGFDSPCPILNPSAGCISPFQILIFLHGFDSLYLDMTICPDFSLPARI